MLKLLKSRKGVTLVELLAVVVILGIIAAIAVPTIGGLIERQEERAAEATFDTIVEAAKLYADDEDVPTRFTLAAMQSADFIDLKETQNDFGLGSETPVLTTAIWVEVNGNTLEFYSVASGGTAVDLWINGYNVQD
jgi:prepilin-type N-terminal cleavage/methylation domain-containing protein